MKPVFVAASLLGALVAGCSVGPKYHRASPLGTNALATAFEGLAPNPDAHWKSAEPAAQRPRGAWWELFNDRELNRLESLALSANQELALELARLDQARALFAVARADTFPHLNAGADYKRQRTSFNQALLGRPAEASYVYHNFSLPFDAGWELDLWGRVRQQAKAARARLSAAADDLEAARLVVQAEVAADYFTWLALEAEYALLEQTVEAYRRALELTRNRRAGGIVSDLDVAQAETQLRTAEAQLPAVNLERTKVRHALATLCGQPATGFALSAMTNPWPAIPATPVCLPSELLERRPDIAGAERRMAAANADAGVAMAAFYPRIALQGLGGLQSVNASSWFTWPSRFWAVGPALQWPVFAGGKYRAQLKVARAAYAEAVARYRQTVLSAFQEVEDQLAAQSLLAAELAAENAALIAARRTLEIALNRYRAGLITYLEVATSQSAALARERTVVNLRAERLAAAAALAKALGGGWTNTETNREAAR